LIKHIIFDFGGVLLDLDYEASWSALKTCLNLDDLGTPEVQRILLHYEVGKISETVFVEKLQRLAQGSPTHQEIIDAWNAMLGPLPSQRLDMLKSLAKDYQIHLLSNANETHIRHVYAYLMETYDISDFGAEYFDRTYFSHLIHMRKPDHEIYQKVIDDIGAPPEVMIFIDDLIENVEGARACGMYGQHHDRTKDVSSLIRGYLDIANAV